MSTDAAPMCYNSKNPAFRLLLALLVVAPACRDAPAPQAPEPEPEALYFEPIGQGQQASLPDTTQRVIREPELWAAYRDSLHPRRDFDAVDFSQTMVLLVALPVPSSGYGIEFTGVEKLDDTITATYTVLRPGEDCMTAPARMVPFQAVAVRRASGTVRFERDFEDLPCTFR